MLTVMTGRSRRLWPVVLSEIGQAYHRGEDRLFLITPDQYTLQAELELVTTLKLPGLMQIEVLSPARLLTRVFTLAGSPQRVRIDARGKAMMLGDVVRQSQEELVYFAGAAGRKGFADRLAATIADFKRAGMQPEDVSTLAESMGEEDALSGKFADIALLYARYEERLAGAFLDGEDAQEAMLQRLPQSGLLEDSRFWVYGFDLITPQFLRQLAVIARGAVSVRLALTWESEQASDGAAFTPSRDTLVRLSHYFDDERLLWEQEKVNIPLETAPEIAHLERELFTVRPAEYAGPVDAISLSMAANPYEEAMCAAARMLQYAREGIGFDEMAVVLGDAEGYAGAIETAFGRSGVPYHMSRERPALAHPLLRAWLAGIRCATLRWRAEDALDWLKGGFSGLTVEEAERLENYAIENGLRGAKWKRSIEDAELERLRTRFVTPLEALQERLRRARTHSASLTALYGLLEDVDAYDTLEAMQQTLSARGMLLEASACAQAWRLTIETLDQLHALLHGDRIRMADIAQIVELGLAAAELGAAPASPGAVQVGQLGHVKIGGKCEVLFLLGMQDGVMHVERNALISDIEAERASQVAGVPMAFGLNGDELAQLQQINLLDTLAAPSRGLFISHAATGPGGEAQRPAAVLKLLRRIFPQMHEEGSTVDQACVWHAPGAALDALGPMLRTAAARDGKLSQAEANVAAWLMHTPQTRIHAEAVLHALTGAPPLASLGPGMAKRLYAHSRTSITRLESFANCPFRHYVQYGLRPAPRRAFEVARDETGTFYHRAMEGYAKIALEEPQWPELTRERSDAIMDAVLAPLRTLWEQQPLGDNAMTQALGEAFCRIARRAAWTYTGQMRRGNFHTGVIEARFGPGEALPPITLLLENGEKRWLEGRIDRIDFLEDEGMRWLRVVDYKSGGTSLDPSRINGGLQLQLLLYLAAALAAFPQVQPAGAFYARLSDPLIETDSQDREEIELLLAKELRLKGILLSDVRVVRAMDGGDALIRKDGMVAKNKELATVDELEALMRHAYDMATGVAERIAAGDIIARPAQLEGWRACAWCDYRSVCGFDPSLRGHQSRTLEKLSKDALMERLTKPEA